MSQDKEMELLPCPFCGSKEVSVANEEPHDNSGGYFIFCRECGASTNLRFAYGDDPVPLLREQWNRRAAHEAPTQAAPSAGEVERDRKDAERYRWLLETFGERRHGAPQLDAAYDDDIDDWRPISFWSIRTADDISAAIDAALSHKEQP